MVNRNAARHLLFGVSILICLFVYMGYRLGTRPRTSGTEAISGIDVGETSDNGETAESPPAAAVSAPPAGSALRPPDLNASGLPVMTPEEAGEALEEWVASSGGEVLRLTPPDAPSSGAPLRPSPAEILDAANLIQGLEPATADESGDDDDDVVYFVDDGEEDGGIPLADASDEEESFMPSLAPPPGASLKPPESAGPDVAAMSLPIPPPGGMAGGPPSRAADSVVSDGGFVPPPPGAGIRPAPAEPARTTPPPPATENAPSVLAPPPAVRPQTPPVAPVQTPSASPAAPDAPPRRDAPSSSESLRFYVVRPGDTLSSIAALELGSASYADNIFLINRTVIFDPDHLMVGMKIRLPVREGASPGRDDYQPAGAAAGPGVASPAPAPTRRPTQGLGRVHRVVSGDTLSSIAQHYYGTSVGWRFLYEANKSVMANPDQLAVGMELSIPPYEETP